MEYTRLYFKAERKVKVRGGILNLKHDLTQTPLLQKDSNPRRF